MTESFRLRHVNWIVGFFLLLVIAVALGLTLAYIFATGFFSKKLPYEMTISQDELGSLKKNAEIYLLGESVGKVDKIEFVGQSLRVKMQIKETYKPQIVEGSTVVLVQPIALANAHLEIRRGSGADPIPAENGRPGILELTEGSNALNDVGSSVGQGMAQIVDNFDRARSSIVWGMGALQRLSQTTERGVDPALEEMRKAIAELRATTARTEVTLKHTLEDIAETSRTMNDRTKTSSTNLDTNIEEMEQSIADANNNLKVAIEKLNRDLAVSLGKFNEVMDKFSDVVDDVKVVTQDLPKTVDGVNNSIEDADDVISGVKRHPLLKNVVPQDQGTRQAAPASVRGGSGS